MAKRRYTQVLKCELCGNKTFCDPTDNICEDCRHRQVNIKRYRESRSIRFDEIEVLVHKWSDARGIFKESTSSSQAVKLLEEYGELRDGISTNNIEEITDGIGDMLVVLTNIAHMKGLTLTECYNHAYNQIKDRKGTMINGVFVKEA